MVPRFASPYRQRGAIGLMAAITLGMALLFMLLIIDSGRIYLNKRQLQSVVDAAALEASNMNAVCSGTGVNALTQATTSAARNGFTLGSGNTLTATCGTLTTGSNNLRTFTSSITATQAIQVTATESVTSSVAYGIWSLMTGAGVSTTTTLHATATAGYVGNPLAQLNIRSSLATVDSSQSPLLNALLGGLLGGSLNLSAAQYNGLLSTNVNLLSYLNQAAITAGITAGDYTTLLNTNLSVTTLVQAAATLVQQNGAAATVTTALGQISAIGSGSTIKLGDLIQTTTGSGTAGLNGNLQLFQLVQGIIQVAAKGNAVSLNTGVSIPGLTSISIQTSIIEPPQFSAIGNPALAKADPLGANRIYVRTAQVRLLISAQLTLVQTLTSVGNLGLGTVTGLLNALSCLFGCTTIDPKILPDATVSIGVEVGSSDAYVTDYSCVAGQKSLTAQGDTAAGTIRVGTISSTDFLSSTSPASASPLLLLDIGTITCGALSSNCVRTPLAGGGLGLQVNVPLASTTSTHTFTNPPDIGQASQNYSFSSTNILGNLSSALSNNILVNYKATVPNLVAGLSTALAGAVTTLTSTLLSPLVSLLATLLDPLINSLLSLLGVDLATANVGANLTCQTGRAQLVL